MLGDLKIYLAIEMSLTRTFKHVTIYRGVKLDPETSRLTAESKILYSMV